MAYEKTEVNVSRSQEQIRDVLTKHGAARFNFGESFMSDGGDGRVGTAGVEFVYSDTLVRIIAILRGPDEKVIKEKVKRAQSRTEAQIRGEFQAQEAKRVWRVLHWVIKARMEAVTEGLETFEQAFLPHIVEPVSGRTLWDIMQPSVAEGALQIGGTGLRALGSGKG